MAYNNYFPATYQPMFSQGYNPYQQMQNQQLQNAQPQQSPVQQQQIQNGGYVIAPSEDYARNYPIAPGVTVTFKDEKLPFMYTKTLGYSPLDRAVFEIYQKIEDQKPAESTGDDGTKKDIDLSAYALKADLISLEDKVDALRTELAKKKAPDKKKGDKDE